MVEPNLPCEVKEILDTLNQAGFEAYIVGGCVRDSLLMRVPKDWDITTSAKPEQVKACFSHTFDTGIKHGTVTVVKQKKNFEVTTYRIEAEYADCRHPDQVFFTDSLKEDLLRRDFTMNAIAYHPKVGYKDPFHGIEDIHKKMIRGVGRAEHRFQEDALRMLRGVRFAAQLGFQLELETKLALERNHFLIEKISVERIREELTKLLLSSHLTYLPLLWETGLLDVIHAQLAENLKKTSKEMIDNLSALEADEILRWTYFLSPLSVNEIQKTLKELKFDTKSMRTIITLSDNLTLSFVKDAYFLRSQMCRLGIPELEMLLKIQMVTNEKQNSNEILDLFHEIILHKDPIFLKDLDINGSDLQDIGMEKGKKIGEELFFLLNLVHKNPSLNCRETLLKLVRKESL